MSQNKNVFTDTLLRPAAAVGAGLILAACSTGISEVPTTPEQPTTSTTYETGLEVINGPSPSETLEKSSTLQVTTERLGLGAVVNPEDYVSAPEGSSFDTHIPLLELKLRDGKLATIDRSPEGINEEVSRWFEERFLSRKTLLTEALQSGSIKSLLIAYDNDAAYDSSWVDKVGYVFGFNSTKDKEVVLNISSHAQQLDGEFVESLITHETLHPLFGDTPLTMDSKKRLSPKLAETFTKACTNLRAAASEEISNMFASLEKDIYELTQLSAGSYFEPRFRKVYEAIHNGDWMSLQQAGDRKLKPIEGVEEQIIPECNFLYVGQMARLASEINNLPTEPAPGEPATSPEMDAKFQDITMNMATALATTTLYSVLTEGTYLPVAPYLGHPQDNLDELAASSSNLVVSMPEAFATKVKALPEEEKQAVVDVTREVIDVIADAHPKLRGYLSDKEAIFLATLHK